MSRSRIASQPLLPWALSACGVRACGAMGQRFSVSDTICCGRLGGMYTAAKGRGPLFAAGVAQTRRPLVVCGPSGVGKGAIIKELQQRHPRSFGFSVSHTTRLPRPGEVNGEHYNFTTREAFLNDIEAGRFIEHAEVHGNLYGTSIIAVGKVAEQGRICVLDIDVQGVRKVKFSGMDPEPHYVFVAPPSRPTPLQALEARLRGRGTEEEEVIQRRLRNAKAELEYAEEGGGKNFDLVLVNDDLGEAVDKLEARIEAWEGEPLK